MRTTHTKKYGNNWNFEIVQWDEVLIIENLANRFFSKMLSSWNSSIAQVTKIKFSDQWSDLSKSLWKISKISSSWILWNNSEK